MSEPSQIDCPLCGVRVTQVASATLSLALWQHIMWACAEEFLKVWIVTDFESGGIRGVFSSQADAETCIADICTQRVDVGRQDFTVQVHRIVPITEKRYA
jgi:hypothetical protein